MKNNSKYSIVTLLLFMLATLTVNATDFTVNSLADTNTGAGTTGTLRWCINQANLAGAGPHTITFDFAITGGTIVLVADLPIVSVSNVTIDGIGDGSGNITIDANGGDIVRSMFRANATGDFATFRNFIMQNTGTEPFRFDGSPTDVTIENIVALHTSGTNWLNYGIYYVGNAVNFTVRNFTMTQKQNIANTAAIHFTGTTTNVLIDNFNLSDSGGGVLQAIRFSGAANTITIINCDIDLDLTASGNDGDFGIYFVNNALNVTITDVNISNSDVYAMYVAGTSTNFDITNFNYINGDGGTTAFGMRFVGVADGITMTNVTLDLDHSGTTDDGNYGIYFNTTTSNVTIDGLTMHDAEVYGFYIGGVATNISILNATFDNFDGWVSNQMIRFNSTVSNITMTDVAISGDLAGTTNDGDYGILFNSANASNITLTRVTVDKVDLDGIRFDDADNLIIDDCTFSNCNSDGIEFINNRVRTNNIIQNSTFDSSGRSGLIINVANATTEFNINNNTFSNTTGNGRGIWLFSTGGVKNIQITNNTFFGNGTAGIYNEQADGVLYSQNSFYNNPLGIDNVANNGNNDLERLDGDTPRLLSSIDVGGGNYDVTFSLPAFCTDCDIEFFTNQAGDANYNGRTYTQVVTALSGVGPHTVTVAGGGATDGFWTTTLKDNNQNGSVSEISGSVAINPKGPANVDAGIALWARADISGQADGNFTVGNGWLDFSGNENNYDQAISSDPELVSNVINFNHSVVFDGNDWLNQLNADLNAYPTGNDDRTVFIVSKITVTSNETAFSYGRNATSQNQSWRYQNGNILYIGWGNDFTGAGAFTVNEPFIGRYDHDGTTASINSDGRQVITSPRTYNTNFSSGSSHIGVRITVGAEGFIGDISEVIVYNRNLTTIEKDRIESYLALKYGITLDQTIATDYFASDGTTTVWDATVNAAYTNDVTGIGRDDDGFFNQKQSKSINIDDIVTIGLGEIAVDNPTNANTFAADKNFLVWGNDNASTTLQTTELPATAVAISRLGREWKVAETGSVSNLTMAFANVPSTAYDIELFIDTDGDGDFTNATVITGGTISGGVATFTGVDLNNNDSFTIGFTAASPGGVVAGLNLWLRADLGTTPSTTGTLTNWEDVAQSNNATQFGARPLPSVIDGSATLFNFNKAIEFTATNQKIGNITSTTLGTTNYDIFSFTKEGMSGTRILNIGRNNTTFNGTNWDSPGFIPSGSIAMRRVSNGSLLYISNPGGTFNATIPSITYHRFTNTSVTKGFNGANTGGVGNYGAIGAPMGGYILGDNRSTGTSGDDAGFTGTVGEFIAYNRNLSATERRQVDSYLAIKYGLTLDFTVAVNDYLLSDASVSWNATVNAAYNNDVAGIGRDDSSALNQKQSISINADAIVVIGLGSIEATNEANTNAFAANKDFLIWGNDNASASVVNTGIPSAFSEKITRNWLVNETGAVSNTLVQIPNSAVAGFTNTTALQLFVADDAGFTTNLIAIPLVQNGANWEATVDFNGVKYFTFGIVASGDFMRHGKIFQGGTEQPMKF